MGGKFDKRIKPSVAALLGREAWHEERKALRAIALGCHLTEEVKWSKLCYTFENSTVAIIYGLKDCCALGFLKGVLLEDTNGLLVKPGQNSQAARWIKFRDLQEIQKMESTLKTYIRQAIEVERAGLKVDFKEKHELVFSKELEIELKGNPALKAAFDALTPGRQRGYNLYFSAPKQSKTRVSRIEKCRERILDGKGLRDRTAVAGEKTFKNSARVAAEFEASKPRLLAGGNPQIPKAEGDAPVEAYLAAMPGWKQGVGRRLDALVLRSATNIRKAVKWNTPLYGIEGKGWFLGFHCYEKFVKVTFFQGMSLFPIPPGESKHKEARYLDIREDDQLDETQFAAWVRQAAALPGWIQ